MAKISEGSYSDKALPVFICDFSPPRSPDPTYLQNAEKLGVDYICVAYNPGKAVRVDSSAIAYSIKQHTGVEVVFNLATRDMNRLALQSHVMGASVLGLENVIVLRGDDFSEREREMVGAVHDFTPTEFIASIKAMNEGVDFRGAKFRTPTGFCAGATVDLSRGEQGEVALAHRKVVAGADFLITQSIYDVAQARRFLELYESSAGEPLSKPVFFGLQILDKDGLIFGDVPQDMRDQLEGGRPGLDIASEILHAFLGSGINTIYLIPPILRGGVRGYETAQRLVEAFRR